MTSSVIYYSTDVHKNEIYLLSPRIEDNPQIFLEFAPLLRAPSKLQNFSTGFTGSIFLALQLGTGPLVYKRLKMYYRSFLQLFNYCMLVQCIVQATISCGSLLRARLFFPALTTQTKLQIISISKLSEFDFIVCLFVIL